MNWTYMIHEVNGIKYFKINGVDNGTANPHGLKIIKETEHYILCRKSGYTGWFALAQTAYYPPEYSIFKKSEEKIVENIFGVWEKEYSRDIMKEAKQESLQKLEEFEKGEN